MTDESEEVQRGTDGPTEGSPPADTTTRETTTGQVTRRALEDPDAPIPPVERDITGGG